MSWRPSGHVALLTDFGLQDHFVGLMHGMVLREHPRATVVDLCHDVVPQDIALGGFLWEHAAGRFPKGTVHVGVVDPGVGTDRRILAALAHDCVWLAPDNGLLTRVLASANRAAAQGGAPVRVREVDVSAQRLPSPSKTFHGRDVFAPVAGRLAQGHFGFDALGPAAGELTAGEDLLAGDPRIVWIDRFGNLVTNIPGDRALRGIQVDGVEARARATYGDGRPGELIAVVNGFGLWEIAEVGGSAELACHLDGEGVGYGDPVEPIGREPAGG